MKGRRPIHVGGVHVGLLPQERANRSSVRLPRRHDERRITTGGTGTRDGHQRQQHRNQTRMGFAHGFPPEPLTRR